MITERLMRQGTWDVTLVEDTPRRVLDQISPFSSIVITPQHLSLDLFSDQDVLDQARYTGMVRRVPRGGGDLRLWGVGNLAWLGDEDATGQRLTGFTGTPQTFAGWVGDLLGPIDGRPSPLAAGDVHALAAPAGGDLAVTLDDVNRRQALDLVCGYYSGEYRVTPGFKLDAGSPGQLFVTDPVALLVRRGSRAGPVGHTVDLAKGRVVTEVGEYLTGIYVLGDDGASGSATTSSSFVDPWNFPVVRERLLTAQTTDSGVATQLAASALASRSELLRTVEVELSRYDVQGSFKVGDYLWIYSPEAGLRDDANARQWEGRWVFPTTTRALGLTWPIRREHGVYLRLGSGAMVDLTPYVVPDTGNATLEVGDQALPSLGSGQLGSGVAEQPSHVHEQYQLRTAGTHGPWTPSYIDLTVGNGIVVARYTQIGTTVHGHFRILFGSTTSVSGLVQVSTPVPVGPYVWYEEIVGDAAFRRPGFYGIGHVRLHGNYFAVFVTYLGSTPGYVAEGVTSATAPFPWASGHSLSFNFTFEAANAVG